MIMKAGKLKKSFVSYSCASVFHLFLLPILVAACFFSLGGQADALSSTFSAKSYSPELDKGSGPRLSVFLNFKNRAGEEPRMELAALEVLANDTWLPLTSGPLTVDSAAAGGTGQMFLARRIVPAGDYQSLRITISSVARKGGGLLPALEQPVVTMPLGKDVRIGENDSASLFITWDVEASLRGATGFAPVLHATFEPFHMTTDLAFVSCSDINTVYILRTDLNWVTGSFGVPGRPTCLSVDSANGRLYILAEQDAAIHLFEIPSMRPLDRFHISLLRDPGYMSISKDGLYAFILDERANYLVRMDLSTGEIVARVRIGQSPGFVLCLSEHNWLAVSSALTHSVFLLDDRTLDTVLEIPVNSEPQGMVVYENNLYITEKTTGMVAVYDMLERRISNRFQVGFSPIRALLGDENIYIANYDSGSVSIMVPGQFVAQGEIPVGRNPREMAYVRNRRWIYIGVEASGSLTVLDSTVNRQVGSIELAAKPLGLAVYE